MLEWTATNDEAHLILWVFPSVLSSSSNGHRSMAYLIQMLVQRGFACGVLVPSRSRFKKLSTLKLPESVVLIKNEALPKSSRCVIAPDTADPNVIEILRAQGHRVLWWLMAPPVLLGSPFPKIQANDSVAIYSSFVLPGLSEYCFVQDPSVFQEALDQQYKQRSNAHLKAQSRRPRIGLYCGKARLTMLSTVLESFLRKAEVVPFSRYWPSSRQEYNELIHSLDGLICFDPLTAVILDIVTQGKPVLLPNNPFPLSAYVNFPLKCLHLTYSNEIEFIRQLRVGSSGLGSMWPAFHRDIQLANDNGYCIFAQLVEKSQVNWNNSPETIGIIDRLQSYVEKLQAVSTIDPCLDGQAPSAYCLMLYLWVVSLPMPFRLWTRVILLQFLRGLDRLGGDEAGRSVLRITIYVFSTLRSVLVRLRLIFWSIYRKRLLPAIRRTLAS